MSLPHPLLSRLQAMHPENFLDILEGFESDRIGSFRINTLKSNKEEVLKEFTEKNIKITPLSEIFLKLFPKELLDFFSQKTPENIFCFHREFEYAIKGTQSFYRGKIYLQSLASMMPVLALSPQKNQKILDVCAAPGSKTTQIASRTNNQAEITALEKNHIRHKKLLYNCELQGANVSTHKIDALDFLNKNNTEIFDSILLDAPCSAEGRISLSREKSYGFWSIKNIQEKAQLQYELFSASLKKLKSGGTLVYSTCTLAPEENEGIISKILTENPDIFLEEIFPHQGIQKFSGKTILPGIKEFLGEKFSGDIQKTLRILPSKYFEGFFLAKIRKK
jgi:16S rRNA (cytosine1407-C5)-methyltransferase